MEHFLENAEPIGYRALVDHFKLNVIANFRWSYIIPQGARRVLHDTKPLIYLYDQSYALDNPADFFAHLGFALKHEGCNLEIIQAFFEKISQGDIQAYIQKQPTGKYQRLIWYLYEMLTTIRLDIPDLEEGKYINLLDPEKYYTSTPQAQQRYRINDNLLGNRFFCPFVRKTEALTLMEGKQLDKVVQEMIKPYSTSILERASHYLYTKETMSSYLIERERPNKARLARFIKLIKQTESVLLVSKKTLIDLQNSIVDPRFSNHDYRNTQIYVGEQRDLLMNIIHYVAPQPKDVDILMQGLLECLQRMITSNSPTIHPIIIAAAISFGFVYIHPFDDGNGRLHRFLIHYILHITGFTPQGLIFPISAVILQDMPGYNAALEEFSKTLMEKIDYNLDEHGKLSVNCPTLSFYRFIDYTKQAEFLATCLEKTIKSDFKKELHYLIAYDQTKKDIQDIVDLPDKLIDLFIALAVQGKGKLSTNKQAAHFSMLTDKEIAGMLDIVTSIMLSAE